MEAQPIPGNKPCCPGLSPARLRHLWRDLDQSTRPKAGSPRTANLGPYVSKDLCSKAGP